MGHVVEYRPALVTHTQKDARAQAWIPERLFVSTKYMVRGQQATLSEFRFVPHGRKATRIFP